MNSIYIYNPTCDMAVENGTLSYMPSTLLRKFEEDISPLVSLMASAKDILITNNQSYTEFVDFWNEAGFEQPTYINWESIKTLNKDYNVSPWGWSPVIAHRLRQFGIEYDFKLPATRQLFSRQTSLDIITEYIHQPAPQYPINFVPKSPIKVDNILKVEELLKQHTKGIILKTLYSSSGRGLLFIKQKKEITQNRNWIEAKIKAHGYVIAEPIYNKIQDASLQFVIENSEYQFLGLNYFDSDGKGKFAKEHIGIPENIKVLLPENDEWIQEAADRVIASMQALDLHKKYSGPVGVDAIFLFEDDENVRFHPIIEANLRCNMGLINMKLKDRIAKNSTGFWQIDTFKPGKAREFFTQQMKEYPLKMKDGKIVEGFIPLSSFGPNQQFAAWGIIK
ncbi:hypothetical protein [Carboxylicivirga linearis]|uniref:ATP-grasp domain-containing protein n=1 Tax=Carboxylicivirga linearis TaxID=1628157 RepID=A0ABS5JS51_9BACT|nr:hypothetical protein [Carboxylicivirga linearis]MBS2097306.1 hypothetical protein [Carboxylicivirga linearis]